MTDLAIWMPHLEKCGSHVMIINYREIPFSAMSPSCLTPTGTHTHFLTHLHTLTVIVFSAGQPASQRDWQTDRNILIQEPHLNRSDTQYSQIWARWHAHTVLSWLCVLLCAKCWYCYCSLFFYVHFIWKLSTQQGSVCRISLFRSEVAYNWQTVMTEIAYFLRWWWTLNSGYAITLWR